MKIKIVEHYEAYDKDYRRNICRIDIVCGNSTLISFHEMNYFCIEECVEVFVAGIKSVINEQELEITTERVADF